MRFRRSSRSRLRERSDWRKEERRPSIWACSEAETTRGGVWRMCDFEAVGKRAMLSTVHQMGIVLDRESGMPASGVSRGCEDDGEG